MHKEDAWVWFKGGEKGGFWLGGFIASESQEDVFLIERPDFINCKVPKWRLSFKEPEDKKRGPVIPDGAQWKIP